MQSKVKLTKREIKEDKFTTFMLTAKDQFQQNWQFYVIGIVVVILLVAAVSYYFSSQSTKGEEASARFARAMLDYQNGNDQIAILGFTEVIDDYGGAAVCEQAVYLVGKINLDTRNYSEAIRYFQMYLDKYKADRISRAAALAGIAVASENQGNNAEAAASFVRASEEYPEGPMAADYELGAVRNFLEVGDAESAEARLAVLKKEHADDENTNRAIRLYTEKTSG